jgi:uncharacterized YigZ family protein
MIPAEISTIKSSCDSRLKEKGSVFIAIAHPVKNIEETETLLSKIRKQYYDASHHCFAYRLSDGIFRYSDDGEPQGTAGLRILNAIDHFNLKNLLVVVIRYFGGTKLGVGPLGKAYYAAATQTLLAAEIIKLTSFIRSIIIVDFVHLNHIYRYLGETDSRILKTDLTDTAKFECLVKPDVINTLKEHIMEITRGKGELNITDDYYLI